jgi:hypothetical protein
MGSASSSSSSSSPSLSSPSPSIEDKELVTSRSSTTETPTSTPSQPPGGAPLRISLFFERANGEGGFTVPVQVDDAVSSLYERVKENMECGASKVLLTYRGKALDRHSSITLWTLGICDCSTVLVFTF